MSESDKIDFRDLRKKAGLTLAEVSEEAGYSIPTIQALETANEGSARLRARLRQMFGLDRPGVGAPLEAPPAPDPARDALLWRKRALAAEAKLQKLRKVVEQFQNVIDHPDPDSPQPAQEQETRKHRLKSKRTRLRDIDTVSVAVWGNIPAGWPQSRAGAQSPVRVERVRRGRFPEGAFALDVRGDSMNAARSSPILDRDTVVLVSPEQREPRHNDIVAALCDGQSTLKRLICAPGKDCVLRAESNNPMFAHDIVPAQELTIQGVMVGKL